VIPSAGLVPAAHDFGRRRRSGGKGVDTRAEPAQGVSKVAKSSTTKPLPLWQNLNRTSVDLIRASQSACRERPDGRVEPGHDGLVSVST
jgi:hypothetical protein